MASKRRSSKQPRFKPRSIVPLTARYLHVIGYRSTAVYLQAGSHFPYTKGYYVL